MRITKIEHVLSRGLRQSAETSVGARTVVLSRDERDALFKRIVLRLNGIDAVQIAVEEEDWKKARELGQEYSDLLALVCTDLGWGPVEAAEVHLTTSPDVLLRAVQAIQREAEADYEIFEQERQAAQEAVERARELVDTCRRINVALA